MPASWKALACFFTPECTENECMKPMYTYTQCKLILKLRVTKMISAVTKLVSRDGTMLIHNTSVTACITDWLKENRNKDWCAITCTSPSQLVSRHFTYTFPSQLVSRHFTYTFLPSLHLATSIYIQTILLQTYIECIYQCH